MSRYRASSGDLAYPEEPQRWDRDRFERIRISERDRPGRTDIRIEDRVDRRGPRGSFEERDYYERDRYNPPPRLASRPRRTDRELFGEEDPRQIAERALAPYRGGRGYEQEIDIEFERRRAPAPRPGLIRRQSSLDTFDRRPARRFDDYRLPANVEIPLPIRRRSRERYEEEEVRYRAPQDYRDVEILREREYTRRGRAKSEAKSVKSEARSRKSDARSVTTARSSSSSSSSETIEEMSRTSSPPRVGKKGRTRMPKRLVKKEVIINLGYPFEEEDDFIVVRRALGKEQIDEVIRISETYNEPNIHTYRYDQEVNGSPPPPGEHYEALRTEWINPPSVRGAPSVRAASPARSARTRKSSVSRTVRAPSPPRREEIIIEHRPAPPPPPPALQPLTIVVPERRERSDRDLKAEIRALEAEQRALRHERDVDTRREIIVRRPEEVVVARPAEESYEVVEYRPGRDRQVVEYVEREKSPRREVVRVEKDRKGRMALVRSAH